MTITPSVLSNEVAVEAHSTVSPEIADELWELYRVAFAALEHRAAARQLLTRDEFDLEVLDPRVVKYVARANVRIAGLSTLTRDLVTVPWISPEFYRVRYPDHFARRSVFYCGLAVVSPDARGTSAFPMMMSALARDIAESDGILTADMCRYNVGELQLARTVTLMMKRVWGSVRHVELDRQLYLAWEPGRPADAS